MKFQLSMALAIIVAVVVVVAVTTFQHPPVDTVQLGYRGTGMVDVVSPARALALVEANKVPQETAAIPPSGKPSSAVYKNIQVLKNVDSNELLRLMSDMANWVAPKQGCAYCHDVGDLSSDKLYTKVVARRMLQMVRYINTNWKSHVDGVGVTCYTCHRGHPVPTNIWFTQPETERAYGMLGNKGGFSMPTASNGDTALPDDPFTRLIDYSKQIRVESPTALPSGDRMSIKQTEGTYALMIHISMALGVNCDFCHDTRSFRDWSQSSPARVTAWHGIRMVRALNTDYLTPLASKFPPERLGPLGDGPKLNCATCHQGAYKPLLGANMLKDYPELAAAMTAPAPAQPTPAPAAPAPAPATPPAAAPAPAPAAPAAPATPPH